MAFVLNKDYQPIFVSSYIKDHSIFPDETCTPILVFNILRSCPACSLRFRVPCLEGLFCTVLLPEVAQGFEGDDSHEIMITCSHFGIKLFVGYFHTTPCLLLAHRLDGRAARDF